MSLQIVPEGPSLLSTHYVTLIKARVLTHNIDGESKTLCR